MGATSTSIVARKTVLGSYIIMRHIASGGMGTVWEGWLNPYAELGSNLIKGGVRDLRSLAGVKSKAPSLTPDEIRKIRLWVLNRTAEFVKQPNAGASFADTYKQMLAYIAPHRRVGGGYRRAIKVLDEHLSGDPKIVQRFVQEVDILARTLDHPSVIKVVESGHAAGKYYAVMEFVDSMDLETEKLTIPQATRVIREALEGLAHAHEQGILHRDIKPANILATRDLEKIKLSDFGIAKALDESTDGKLTSTGVIVGTPHYMDPERARGEAMGTESDVYALGATFYKLLSGKPPVVGQSPLDTMGQIGHEKDVPWVRTTNSQVSEELEDLVMMMLAKDRRARPTTYEVRDQLARIEKGNLLFHQEPTENQSRDNRKALKKALAECTKLRKMAVQNAAAATRYYDRVSQAVDLMPRTDATSISTRIDQLQGAMQIRPDSSEGKKEDTKPGASILEKKAALEKRRLEKDGFEYIARQPHKIGRKLLVAVAGTVIIVMAVLFSLIMVQRARTTREVDRALEKARAALQDDDTVTASTALRAAREAAKDLPQSASEVAAIAELSRRLEEREMFAEAKGRHGSLERHLAAREYSRASQEIDAVLQALATLKDTSDPDLKDRVKALRTKITGDQERITKYASDIQVYTGLMESFSKVHEEFERLRKDRTDGKAVALSAADALIEQVAQLQTKLRNRDVVDPASIGPELGSSLKLVEQAEKDLKAFRAGLQ